MALESATYVGDLNTSNPTGTDAKSQGDDHLRLLKSTLQATFPLATAARKFGSTDAGATDVLTWLLFRNSASPANSDLLGSFAISGNNDAGSPAEKVYARLQAQIVDKTASSEDGAWLFKNMVAGAETLTATLSGSGFDVATLLGAGRPPTVQLFTATATWTKPSGCKRILAEGTGGGGGSGGVNGQGSGYAGASGGGGGGFSGRTAIIDVESTSSFTVTIGSGGTAGSSAGGNGGDGGTSQFTVGATTYSFGGGAGSSGIVAAPYATGNDLGGAGGSPANVTGMGQPGQAGRAFGLAGVGSAFGGNGGSTLFGSGGRGNAVVTATAAVGAAPAGFGGGGGGSVSNDTSSDASGRAGADGYIRITEFY